MTAPEMSPSPLVGRDHEFAILRERLADAVAGRGSLVLIGGEAGIGKTALAEALCREAAKQDAFVLVGRCYDLSETPPYGPWLELFGRYRAEDGMPSAPVTFAERGTVRAVTSQDALFRQVRDFLVDLAAGRLLVLLLDDLHWADPASLDLLRSVARAVLSLPLLILTTYRSDEITRRHPLYAMLPALVHEAHPERLDLRALSEDDVRDLIGTRYHLPPVDTARLLLYLRERAEGNPFFLGELLRALQEEGALRAVDGGWVVDDPWQVRIPPLLRQVIDGRLVRLGGEAQALLGVAAVIGQDVPFALWASVSGVDEEMLAPVAEQAVEAHLMAEMPDGRQVRFVHALIRETLYEGMRATRRRMQHQRIGDALAAMPGADPDTVAYHLRQAGDGRAVEWLILAAERAHGAAAWRTAADRYEAAAALIPATRETAGRRGWLLAHAGWLRRFADVPAAIDALEAATRLAMDADDAALLAYASFRLGGLLCRASAFARGLAMLERGAAALDALPDRELTRLHTLLGWNLSRVSYWSSLVMSLAHAGRYAEARSLGEHLVASAHAARDTDKHDVAEELWSTYFGLGLTYAALGMPAAARDAFARSRPDIRTSSQPMTIATTAIHELAWAVLPYHADRVVELHALVRQLDEALVRASGILADDRSKNLGYVTVWVLEGRWAEARATAMHAYDAPGSASRRLLAIHALAALMRHQGERDSAWRLVGEWFPDGPGASPGDSFFLDSLLIQRCAAYLALEGGDHATARAWLEAHDRWIAWSGAVLGVADGHLGWASYHREAGERNRAYEHATRALAHASEPRQPLTLLAAHRLLGELDTEAGRHAAADAHLHASLALAEACAAPYERTLTLLALAQLRAATGEPEVARALLDDVCAICEPLGAKPALAHAEVLAARLADAQPSLPLYPDRLTAREVEILRLIAAGKSNRDIATTLSISVRTVNRHIENLYGKIGAHGKADATAYALRHHLA